MDRKRCLQEYKFLCELGKGGFAIVWKAIDLINDKIVAIKQVKKKPITMVRAVEEAKIHAQLKHESILEMEACFEDDNFFYFVLEYCSHGDLASFLQMCNRSKITEAEARSIVRQVLGALVYLQKHNIVHRDIKMANLLLDDQNRIKIGDFGLATKGNHPRDSHMTFCGTPNFISPEMAAQMEHGVAVDVWGVGILLYTLLVGQAPFANSSVKSTLNEVLSKELYIPSDVSQEAADLLRHLLAKNPSRRISVLNALKHPFFQLEHSPLYGPEDIDSGIHSRSIFCLTDDGNVHHSTSLNHASMRSQRNNKSSINLGSAFLFQQNHSNLDRAVLSRETPSVANSNHREYSSQSRPMNSDYCFSASRQNSYVRTNGHQQISDYSQRCDSVAENNQRVRNGNDHHQSPVYSKSSDSIEVFAFSTKRLRPTQVPTPIGIFYILSKGEAMLETNHPEGGSRYWKVTPEGYMFMYRGSSSISQTPALPSDAKQYRISQLPNNWRPVYRKIAAFVRTVQSTTIKLTLNSSQTSCRLMESLDDFIIRFATGETVEKHGDNVTVQNPDKTTTMHKFDLLEHEGERNSLIIVQFLKLHHDCLRLERMLSAQAPSDFEIFPAIFGGQFCPNKERRKNDSRFLGDYRAQSTPIKPSRFHDTTDMINNY